MYVQRIHNHIIDAVVEHKWNLIKSIDTLY